MLHDFKNLLSDINWIKSSFSSVQFSHSVMFDSLQTHECNMPGLPVHHHLRSSLRPMSIESVMQSSHLSLCRALLLLPPKPSQYQSLFQ